jgi:hypothetical protein
MVGVGSQFAALIAILRNKLLRQQVTSGTNLVSLLAAAETRIIGLNVFLAKFRTIWPVGRTDPATRRPQENIAKGLSSLNADPSISSDGGVGCIDPCSRRTHGTRGGGTGL